MALGRHFSIWNQLKILRSCGTRQNLRSKFQPRETRLDQLVRHSSSVKRRDSEQYGHLKHPDIYEETFRRSLEQPDDFWTEAAQGITWYKTWDKVLDHSNPPFTKWFVGGELNMCYNAVDRHIEAGHGDQIALIHDSPMTGTIKYITYKELQQQVSLCAGMLASHGVKKGDRTLIYMPMIPEAVFAMLASARIGAVHSLVFGGFASKELATRINHAEPKVVLSANAGKEPTRVVPYKPLLDKAIELSEFKPDTCIIFNRESQEFERATLIPGRDFDWSEEMSKSCPHDPVPVSAMDALYLLYTSGTTGDPKAVVRPTGGHAVSLHWSMVNQYGVNSHETWFAASDLGWVVGHSYIVYAPLLHCNTSVLYEGKPVGTPDPGAYFRMFQQHKIVSMFVAPTAMRAIRRDDPEGKYASKYTYPDFRYLFIAGEHCDYETMEWIRTIMDCPVLDNWWQTETGSAITSTCVGLGNMLKPPPGVTGKPYPGWDVKVIRSDGTETEDDELGNIVAKLPLPPGVMSTLWRNDERFKSLYFDKYPGYYNTMDSGYRDPDGNIAVMARSDDVINVAGHRLSTGQLEEAILECGDVAESAVVAVKDSIKGHIPLALVVLKSGVKTPEEELKVNVKKVVRESVGPIATLKDCVLVSKLPKTRSGKVARHTVAAMLAQRPFQIPVTIEDASVYPHMKEAFMRAGLLPVEE